MTADTYTFYSPSAGDWVTKCAECGAWWLAGAGDGWHVCATATLVPVTRDPHPSDGCGLCGWDGPEDETPCPSHRAEVAAWNLRHMESEPLPTRPANPAFSGTLRGISAGRQVGEP